jgi:hypothetical protein
MGAEFVLDPPAEHVTAFTLVDQHAHPRGAGVCDGNIAGCPPLVEIGLNLLIESAPQTIKGIHAFYGFDYTG